MSDPFKWQRFKDELAKCVEDAATKWCSIVENLGVGDQDCLEWIAVFKSEQQGFLNEMIADVQSKQDDLSAKIEQLLERIEHLCSFLNTKMPQFESTNKGMYHDEKYLIEYALSLQEEINEKTFEVNEIKIRRDELCKSLGSDVFVIPECPLPTKQDMQLFREQIKAMETEKQKRQEKFLQLKSKIAKLALEIEYVPKLNMERDLINNSIDDNIDLTDESMKRIEEFYRNMQERRKSIDGELLKLRETLQNLWKLLEEDIMYCNDFIRDHIGVNYSALDAFRVEVQRCEHIRQTNLHKFVLKLRVQLVDLWEEAGFTPAQRSAFACHMEDDLYTEDLLTLHDLEIERVKLYLEKNGKIFDLLKQREEMYKRMKDLEERAKAPNRYKNRGGQLLKEEKERKAVQIKIPAIEETLLMLAMEYEVNNVEPFTYFGETIECLINSTREHIEEAKKQQMSARKEKNATIMASASRLTPSKLFAKSPKLTIPRGPLTPLNARTTPLRTPRTAPNKKTTFSTRRSITKAKRRVSTDKKQRTAAIRRAMLTATETQNGNKEEVNYSHFADEMSKRDAFRSTMSINSPHSSVVLPAIRVDTPKTTARRLQPASSRLKLDF